MATIRKGTKSVLVIVDAQVAVMKQAWDSSRVISNIATVVNKARSNGVPVVWVQHSDDQLTTDNPEWELVPDLSPNSDETVIHKRFASAFEETDLEKLLEDLSGSHIFLMGAATNFCIRASAYGALDRGYDLTLVSDAHTTGTMELNGKTIYAEDIVADLNAVMSWIKYPGRTNQTVATSELDFATVDIKV